jgi:hypothetical protein
MLVLFVIWKLLLKDKGMTLLTRILGINNTSHEIYVSVLRKFRILKGGVNESTSFSELFLVLDFGVSFNI